MTRPALRKLPFLPNNGLLVNDFSILFHQRYVSALFGVAGPVRQAALLSVTRSSLELPEAEADT